MGIKELQTRVRDCQKRMAESVKSDDGTFESVERECKMAMSELELAIKDEQARACQAPETVSREQIFLAVMRNTAGKKPTPFKLQREISKGALTADALNNIESAGVPISIQDLIGPLEMETIYDKVGLQIQATSGTEISWPFLDTVAEVKIAGETVQLGDTDLDFSKITAVQKRMGISIKVTNEALDSASFDLQGTVINEMRKAIGRVLNRVVIGSTAVDSDLKGPFTGIDGVGSVTFAGSLPTYQELVHMKGTIANKGVKMNGFCYVVNATTYADLEGTCRTEGDSRTILEGGKIAGYPVFQTSSELVPDGCVYAGCFAYAVLNQHGDTYFIVDPYSLADSNEVKFTLNANWSLTVLRPEAFCIGTGTATAKAKA